MAQQADDRVLQLVDVLVLVHEDVLEQAVVRAGGGARVDAGRRRVAEDLERVPLQVGKIELAAGVLGLAVTDGELLDHAEQHVGVRDDAPGCRSATRSAVKRSVARQPPSLISLRTASTAPLGDLLVRRVGLDGRQPRELQGLHLRRERVRPLLFEHALPVPQAAEQDAQVLHVLGEVAEPGDQGQRSLSHRSRSTAESATEQVDQLAAELGLGQGRLGRLDQPLAARLSHACGSTRLPSSSWACRTCRRSRSSSPSA